MPRIYLAGPMTGLPEWNFPTFHEAAKRLRALGWDVCSPAENFGGRTDLPYRTYLRAAVRQVTECDAIALLPGWDHSNGALTEMRVARVLGLPAYSDAGSLMDPQPVVCVAADWRDLEADQLAEARRLEEALVVPEPPTEPRVTTIRLTPTSGEVRVTDPTTGGEKGQKLARFDLLPWDALWQVAEHYGRGAAKYADRNWEKGYRYSLSLGALLRHVALFAQGEDSDPETQSPHMAAVVFHALALLAFVDRGIGTDDRPRTRIPQ